MATKKLTDKAMDSFSQERANGSSTVETLRSAFAGNPNYNPYTDPQYTEGLNRYSEAIAGGYDRQRELSAQQYAQNRSAADRQMLSRGMGRSSYNSQILSQIDTAGAKAQQEIYDKQQEAVNQYGINLASELRSLNQQQQQLS